MIFCFLELYENYLALNLNPNEFKYIKARFFKPYYLGTGLWKHRNNKYLQGQKKKNKTKQMEPKVNWNQKV